MNDLIRRQRALQKTVNKYQGKALDWKAFDCVRMVRSHLVAMGHRGLPKLPRYSSPIGAKRALKEAGFESLQDMLGKVLVEIPPASMLPGDIALMEGHGTFDAITISVGRKVMGWHEDNGLQEPVMIVPEKIKAAFRA